VSKRVAVMCLERVEVCDSRFDDQRLETMLFMPLRQPWMRRFGKIELAEAVLCCRLL